MLPFRQPTPQERPSRDLAVAVFVSIVIHVLTVYLLWVVISGSTAFDSAVPTNGTPLILTLSTFESASNEETESEEISVVPHTDTPAQPSQSLLESSHGAWRESQAGAVMTPKEQSISNSEAYWDKSHAVYPAPSFELEAASSMEWDFGVLTAFKDEAVATSEIQNIPCLGEAGGKPLAGDLNRSFGLEHVFQRERESEKASGKENQDIKINSRMLQMGHYAAKYRDPRRNCRTAYSRMGLLSIPFLIKDAITGNGCKWEPGLEMVEQSGHNIISPAAEKFNTLLPFSVDENKIIFNITKEGEIWVKGKKINLNAIQDIMEIFKNEYPDGNVIITCARDSLYKTAMEVFDHVRAVEVKMVVVASVR